MDFFPRTTRRHRGTFTNVTFGPSDRYQRLVGKFIRRSALRVGRERIAMHTRKLIVRGLMTALVVSALAAVQPASARDLTVEVDGRRVYLGYRQQAYLDRGVWMIPAIPVLRERGIWARWDGRRGELEVALFGERLLLYAGSYTIVNGSRREILSRPVAVHHGDPFVPVEFLERCLQTRAYYDPDRSVLSFGDGWGWRDRWDWRDRRSDDDRRRHGRPDWNPERSMRFTVDPPGRSWGPSIEIRGRWDGSSVRIRVYRENGRECINRTAGPRNGEWSASLSLSAGRYRAVIEAYDGRVMVHRREMEFSVR
jgi:hypothetical protein